MLCRHPIDISVELSTVIKNLIKSITRFRKHLLRGVRDSDSKSNSLKHLNGLNIGSKPGALKVIIVNKPGHPIPHAGGIERYSLELAKHLAKNGIDVALVSAFPLKTPVINVGKLKLINAPLPLHRVAREGSFLWFLHHIVGSFIYTLKAFKYLVKSRATVIHVNEGFTATLLHLLRTIAGLRFAIVTSIHAPPPWKASYGKHPLLVKLVYILLYIAGMIMSDAVIGINPLICNSINIKRIASKCIFIPNAMPDDVLTQSLNENEVEEILKNYGIDRDYYLFVGRLVPEKGIDRLIKLAYKYEHEYKGKDLIVIVGRGPLEKYIQRACRLLKSLRYVGYIPRDHLKAFYVKAKALLITSRAEGMPTVMLEALAHGTPVITIKFDGIEEISKLADSKALIVTENLDQTTQSLINQTLQSKISEEVIRRITEEYNWNTIARKVMNIYREVLKGKVNRGYFDERRQYL